MRVLATLTFDRTQQEAIMARVPAERAHVDELKRQGVLEAIYIAADGSRVWLVLHADTTDAAQEILKGFPLYPYMHPELTPLNP